MYGFHSLLSTQPGPRFCLSGSGYKSRARAISRLQDPRPPEGALDPTVGLRPDTALGCVVFNLVRPLPIKGDRTLVRTLGSGGFQRVQGFCGVEIRKAGANTHRCRVASEIFLGERCSRASEKLSCRWRRSHPRGPRGAAVGRRWEHGSVLAGLWFSRAGCASLRRAVFRVVLAARGRRAPVAVL